LRELKYDTNLDYYGFNERTYGGQSFRARLMTYVMKLRSSHSHVSSRLSMQMTSQEVLATDALHS